MSRVTSIVAGADVAPGRSDSATEARLLERFIESRDEAAFEALVRAHGPMVYGVCLRMLGNHADADDAFQATFLAFARKAASIAHRGMPANWLFRVAHRSALKVRSANGKRRQMERSMNALPETAVPMESEWTELAPVLDEAVHSLPYKYQVAVVLCDLEGKTRKEAARELGWAEGTLGSRLTRAREILAGRLSRRGIVVSAGTLAVFLSQNALSAAVPAGLVATTAHAAVAAVSLPATSVSVFAAKGAAIAEGVAKAAPLTKGIAAVVLAGVVAAAGVGIQATQTKPPNPPAPPAFVAGSLPPEILQALEENVRQLSPISVSYRTDLKHELGDEIMKARNTNEVDEVLEKIPDRTVWQDNRLYASSTRPRPGGANANVLTVQTETTYVDGVVCQLLRHEPDGSWNLFRRPVDWNTSMGYLFLPQLEAVAFLPFGPAQGDTTRLAMESEILRALRDNGTLLSMEDVPFDGRRHVRITLETDNFVRKQADAMAKLIEENDRRTPPPPEQVQQRATIVAQMEARRQMPARRRYIFDLDPAMNYAIRKCEQYYGTETLLSQSVFSNFEQVPGRNLWLPRNTERVIYEMPVTAKPSKEKIATQTMMVAEWDFAPVADERFVLKCKPGTIVFDATLPEAKDSPRRGVVYVVPERAEELDAVIATARREAIRPAVDGDLVLNSTQPSSTQAGPAGAVLVPSGTAPQAREFSDGRPLNWSTVPAAPAAGVGLETADATAGPAPESPNPIRILIALNGALLLAALGYVLIRRWRAR